MNKVYSYGAQLKRLRDAQTYAADALGELEACVSYEGAYGACGAEEYEALRAQVQATFDAISAMASGVHEMCVMHSEAQKR